MRIITCLKYVPETFVLNEEGGVDRSSECGKISSADMYAIEESVRIKERYGAETIGLCMGIAGAAAGLKKAVAMGIDRVVLMSDKRFAGSDTCATSYILSKGIDYIGKYDLVICGRKSTDGSTGQTAQELAVHLGIPCLINVVSLQFTGKNTILCTILTERGYMRAKMRLPAVVSVLKGINEPRIPSVSGILKAESADIHVIDADDVKAEITRCGLAGSPTKVRTVRQCRFEPRKAIDITNRYLFVIEHELQNIYDAKHLSLKAGKKHFAKNEKDALTVKVQSELWVLCEISDGKLSKISRQILSKAATIVKRRQRLCAVILEQVNGDFRELLADYNVSRLYYNDKGICSGAFDEFYPNILYDACQKYKPEIVLFGSSVWGQWIAPIVAAKLRTGLTADCLDLKIEEATGNLLQIRTACGGNLIAEIVCPQMRPQMATVHMNTFPDFSVTSRNNTSVEIIDISDNVCVSSRITVTGMADKHFAAQNLADAEIVLCGGRGIGGRQGFDMLFELANLMGGAVGATRYAVDAGWIDYSFQIGQTGITVRPKLYIDFGVSGAAEHIVGMSSADCIISVNRSESAPIFEYSDYQIHSDCHTVLREMLQYFRKKEA